MIVYLATTYIKPENMQFRIREVNFEGKQLNKYKLYLCTFWMPVAPKIRYLLYFFSNKTLK